MRVQILLFASASQLTGLRSVDLNLAEDADLQSVANQLATEYPALKSLIPVSRWAINHQFMPLSTKISADQELALIPPVSGG